MVKSDRYKLGDFVECIDIGIALGSKGKMYLTVGKAYGVVESNYQDVHGLIRLDGVPEPIDERRFKIAESYLSEVGEELKKQISL